LTTNSAAEHKKCLSFLFSRFADGPVDFTCGSYQSPTRARLN
jgi:hypothetical protein